MGDIFSAALFPVWILCRCNIVSTLLQVGSLPRIECDLPCVVVSIVLLSPFLCGGVQYVVVSLMSLSHLCDVWWSPLYSYLPCSVMVSSMWWSPLWFCLTCMVCGGFPCTVISLVVWWSPVCGGLPYDFVSLVWCVVVSLVRLSPLRGGLYCVVISLDMW